MKKAAQPAWWFLDISKAVIFPSLALLFRIKKYCAQPGASKAISGPAILVCNHASVFEPLVLLTAFFRRRLNFLVTKRMFGFRPFGWMLWQFGCVPVDLNCFEMSCIFTLAERVKQGHVAMLFPEGHVSPKEGMLPFKSGAVMLALQTGAPIVPVFVSGGYNLLKRRRVAIGAPIDAAGMAGPVPTVRAVEQATELVERRMQELGDFLKNNGI